VESNVKRIINIKKSGPNQKGRTPGYSMTEEDETKGREKKTKENNKNTERHTVIKSTKGEMMRTGGAWKDFFMLGVFFNVLSYPMHLMNG